MGHTLDPPARHPARNTMNGINTRRNHGLDTLRGVGLLIVITAHAGMGELCRGWLVFGIPLFYLVAGYLYRDATSLKEFIVGKFRRLIIPFLFFAAAGLAIYVAGNCLLLRQPFNAGLFNLLSLDRYYLPYPASLWFFLSIFWCYLFFALVRRLTHSEATVGIACLLIGTVGWILSRTIPLPLSIDTAMSWLPMFYLGHLLAVCPAGQKIVNGEYWIAGTLLAAACCITYVKLDYNVGYCYNLFIGDIPAILLLTAAATTGVTCLCCKMGYIPLLSYIGRNSLVIFAGHQHTMIIIEQGARYLGFNIDTTVLRFGEAATSICACVILTFILRKYAPTLIGERSKGINRHSERLKPSSTELSE